MYAFSAWHSRPNSSSVFTNRGNILPTSIPANWKDIFDVSLKEKKLKHVNYIERIVSQNIKSKCTRDLQVELEAVSLYINYMDTISGSSGQKLSKLRLESNLFSSSLQLFQ